MKVDVSVIIPIYKGRQYIAYWLDTIRKNAMSLHALQLRCELILVNDFPEERIGAEEFQVSGFDLKVLNSNENKGIHGARVYGLEHARGEWVVFIDQDDWITDDYLMKQKQCMGEADAVICNGCSKLFCRVASNFIYADRQEQERTTELSYYLTTGNPIYSPGQVMLKKTAIPRLWLSHKMKANGADDYLLWILMLKEGKKFVLNEEKMYTHVGHGENASNDMYSMVASIHEVEQILFENNLLDEAEKKIVKNREIVNMSAVRYRDIIETYDYWLYLENRQRSVADFLCGHGYYKIGVYGLGSIGNRLCDLLDGSSVEIVFAIDRSAKGISCRIPVFCLEDPQVEGYMKQVDMVIITAQSAFQEIREEIRKRKYEVSLCSLKDILLEMIESAGQ